MAIVAKARSHGAWLAVHENFRFSTAMRNVKKVPDQGTIGIPTWARLSWRTGFDVYRGQPNLAEEDRPHGRDGKEPTLRSRARPAHGRER